MATKSGLTKDEKIVSRLEGGREYIARYANQDYRACQRYLDSSSLNLGPLSDPDEGGMLPLDQAVGNINWLMVNILTKVATVTIGDPDFHMDSDTGDFSEIARKYMRELWERRHWARTARKAYLKRCISGIGIIAYLWDDTEGPVFEHVRLRDFAVDPNFTDWQKPRWAARKIRLPKEEAQQKWPGTDFGLPNEEARPFEGAYRDSVELWVYWDLTTEAVLFSDKVLSRSANLYGKIPLLFVLGDINPESEFPIGDYQIGTGINQALTEMQDALMAQAKHGGGIGWFRPEAFKEPGLEALKNGYAQEFVEIEGMAGADAIGYTAAQPMHEAQLEVLRMMQQGLDSTQGVNEYQRGVINQPVKFATEAAMLANQSGGRGTQARVEYERFVEEMAEVVIDMTLQFGNPVRDNDALLVQALQSVRQIVVLENSTAWKDPAFEMQSSVQLLQLMMPFMQLGIVDPLPLIVDVFKAFGRRDTDKYLTPQAQQAAEQMVAMAQASQQQPASPMGGPPSSSPAPDGPPASAFPPGAPFPPAGAPGGQPIPPFVQALIAHAGGVPVQGGNGFAH